MRIGQICPYFWPHVGGVESHVAHLSEELAQRGHDVVVITSAEKNWADGIEDPKGVKVVRVQPIINLFSSPYNPGIKRALRKEHRIKPFDILHAHSPPPLESFYASRFARRNKIPIAVTHHCDLFIPGLFGRFAVGLYRLLYERRTIARTTKVVVTTKTYSATSRSLWRENPIVIPNAVNHQLFHPEHDVSKLRHQLKLENKKVVLYVGRLVYHKGLEWFIRAANFTDEDTQFIVVGGGPLRAKLERTVAKEGLEGRVRFVGKVANEELPLYFGLAHVFVLPSISRLEAFGIAALEAMSSGVPVLISNIPGVREVIEEGVSGLSIEPLDPQDIGEKIKQVLDSPDTGAAMGRAARIRVETKFTWEKVATALEAVYIDMT